MVKVSEFRRIVREGSPPFKIIYETEEGSGEEEIMSAKDVLGKIKELFGGSLRGAKIEVSERDSTTEVLIYKTKGPRVRLIFKRHKQLSLVSFFQ
ncbi:MAG: hypothetical protein ACTSUJ_03950 [Candidatus Njordarchaeales archaeon]